MEWLQSLDGNFVLTLAAVALFVAFMFKGGCGAGMCGTGRHSNKHDERTREKTVEHEVRR